MIKFKSLFAGLALAALSLAASAAPVQGTNGNVGYTTFAECQAALPAAKVYVPTLSVRKPADAVEVAMSYIEGYPKGGQCVKAGSGEGEFYAEKALEGSFVPVPGAQKMWVFKNQQGQIVHVAMGGCNNRFPQPRRAQIAAEAASVPVIRRCSEGELVGDGCVIYVRQPKAQAICVDGSVKDRADQCPKQDIGSFPGAEASQDPSRVRVKPGPCDTCATGTPSQEMSRITGRELGGNACLLNTDSGVTLRLDAADQSHEGFRLLVAQIVDAATPDKPLSDPVAVTAPDGRNVKAPMINVRQADGSVKQALNCPVAQHRTASEEAAKLGIWAKLVADFKGRIPSACKPLALAGKQ